MPISSYLRELRALIGNRLLLMPGVAAIVRNEAGEILLQKRTDDGKWSLPSGAIDPGETPEEAVVREVYEETGLKVKPFRNRGAFGGKKFRQTYPSGDQVEYTINVFDCRIESGALQCLDGESAELRFWRTDAMPWLACPYPPELFKI